MTRKPINNRHNIQKGLCVYMLHSNHKRQTYVGYTTNIKHRLRQHCGLISGGAKATRIAKNKINYNLKNNLNNNNNFNNNNSKNYHDWEPVFIITGFTNRRQAQQLEWRIQHPKSRIRLNRNHRCCDINYDLKGKRVRERVMELRQIMNMERWTRLAVEHSKELNLTLCYRYVNCDYETTTTTKR